LRGDATTDVAYSENLGFGAAITERWKLISHEESGEAVALFDLESDPFENQNLVGQPGGRAALDDMRRGPMRSLLERPTVFREDARPGGRGGHDD
jgi:hypothetical protein